MLRKALRILVDLVYPEACLLCGRVFSSGAERTGPVCAACESEVSPLSGSRCRDCGLPLISELERCVRCRGRTFAFDGHRSLFAYAGEARELLYYYKFRGRAALAGFLAERMRGAGLWEGEFGAVVPVPSRSRRNRRLGYAPVSLLSRKISRSIGVPYLECLTVRPGRAQKSLSIDERLANLAGRIGVRGRSPDRISGNRVILVDDIFTTGATVHECARVLKANGASFVRAVTIAQEA